MCVCVWCVYNIYGESTLEKAVNKRQKAAPHHGAAYAYMSRTRAHFHYCGVEMGRFPYFRRLVPYPDRKFMRFLTFSTPHRPTPGPGPRGPPEAVYAGASPPNPLPDRGGGTELLLLAEFTADIQ